MQVEVSVALNFIISYLYNKLPRRRVDMFGEELEKGMKKKFEGHWYPTTPFKGSGYRCVRVIDEKVDPVLEQAAKMSGLDIEEIKEYLPKDFAVWVDPGEVSYRIGEKGIARVVYSNKTQEGVEGYDKEIQAASKGFNPEAQCFKPIDSLSSSLSNLSVSPSSPGSPPTGGPFHSSTSPITSFLNRNNNTPMFTTATFAQTKFGSTKLKSQAKRPTRLSPTEQPSPSANAPFLKAVRSMPGLNQQQQQQQSPTGNPAFLQHSPTGNNGFIQQSPTGNPAQPAGFIPMSHTRSRTLSPRDVMHRDLRQEYLEQQHRFLLAQQQHHSQFGQNPSLLSPMNGSPLGGSLSDLYGSYQANGHSDLLRPTRGQTLQQGTPSPDATKSLLDAVNINSLPPYANLQHLLVAN